MSTLTQLSTNRLGVRRFSVQNPLKEWLKAKQDALEANRKAEVALMRLNCETKSLEYSQTNLLSTMDSMMVGQREAIQRVSSEEKLQVLEAHNAMFEIVLDCTRQGISIENKVPAEIWDFYQTVEKSGFHQLSETTKRLYGACLSTKVVPMPHRRHNRDDIYNAADQAIGELNALKGELCKIE